jgi:flagellar biogenesis protein FliO
VLVSVLALLAPLAALALVVAFCWLAVRFMRWVLHRTSTEPTHE